MDRMLLLIKVEPKVALDEKKVRDSINQNATKIKIIFILIYLYLIQVYLSNQNLLYHSI